MPKIQLKLRTRFVRSINVHNTLLTIVSSKIIFVHISLKSLISRAAYTLCHGAKYTVNETKLIRTQRLISTTIYVVLQYKPQHTILLLHNTVNVRFTFSLQILILYCCCWQCYLRLPSCCSPFQLTEKLNTEGFTVLFFTLLLRNQQYLIRADLNSRKQNGHIFY